MNLLASALTLLCGLCGSAEVKPAAAEPPATKAPAQPTSQGQETPAANPDEAATKAIPYHPTLTRDPFASIADADITQRGDLVEDIGVKGRVVIHGKAYAVVSDSRGNVRTLPVGYRFKDGEIVAIDEKSVTFHQWEVTSTNRSVFRTVVRTFKREEGKR